MLFKKLSTVERVYNIGLEQNSLSHIFDNINVFVKEAEEDLIKLYDLRILEKIPVKNIMTKHIITINKDDDISKLREYIEHYRHMGYPVVDENGKLIGVVTFKDLEKTNKKTIKDIMTPKDQLILISPETSASESQKIMAKNDIGRLLVVDGKGNLMGIVSRGDIVKTYRIYSEKTSKIQKCSRITNFYFYDKDKNSKLKKLAEDLIILLGGRDYIVSEKDDYIEMLTRDWEPLAKIMKSGDNIDHISITTKSINILQMNIIHEILKTIEKYGFEEIVITDHITLIDEKSAIQRIITDVTSFKESKKTFGTITIRSDF
ncbi:CBS domain-containing protein [Methanothermococcus sp. Ax23]|jgi:CBS domain-containing protein|uniref:CBS domain-containing protein n=1 Tax=Methanothermococcus sp. Ax23 TaxID=3156486 RepID=UPI003BA0C0BD